MSITPRRTELLPALRDAVAILRAASAEAWAVASDDELRELIDASAQLRQEAERQAALGAGEVLRRSRPELGLRGFAQRAGHRTVDEFLRARTGATARDAATARRVGMLTVEGDGAGGALGRAVADGRVSVASAAAIDTGLGSRPRSSRRSTTGRLGPERTDRSRRRHPALSASPPAAA